jgi:hypothetical protein
MALTIQNLRNASAGQHPGQLEPGQLAFNTADSVGYVGNGTNANTLIDGTTTGSPPAGKGWIQFPLRVATITAQQQAANAFQAPLPNGTSAGQVLTWNGSSYVAQTPGQAAVYALPNDTSQLNAGGPLTADLVQGLITATTVGQKSDLNAGDTAIVTDSGNADASANVGVGTYLYDGTDFIKLPGGGGGANILNDLTNVNDAPATVAWDHQAGLIVRDNTVTNKDNPNAYKLISTIDLGIY